MPIIPNPQKLLTKPTGRPKGSPKSICNNPEVLDFIREKLSEGYNTTGVWKGIRDRHPKLEVTLTNVRKIIQRKGEKI